jgi:hypothetical protein
MSYQCACFGPWDICSWLALHEKRGVRQVLSTGRPVLPGAVELEQVTWNSHPRILEGTSLGPADTDHNPWFPGGPFRFHDFPGYALKMMDQHSLQIRVRLRGSARRSWTADVGKLFAASRCDRGLPY